MAFEIAPPPVAVVARHIGGREIWFASKLAALEALGRHWIRKNVAREFGAAIRGATIDPRTGTLLNTTEWVLETIAGLRLVLGDLLPPHKPRHGRLALYGEFWYLENYPGYGPVPFTGRRTAGHFLRHPQTANEKRRVGLVVTEDGEVPPRAKRNLRNLVDAYDDIHIAARANHNWKQYRKRQWKHEHERKHD